MKDAHAHAVSGVGIDLNVLNLLHEANAIHERSR